jgi:hypothetical protein
MIENDYVTAFGKGFCVTQLVEIPLVWFVLTRQSGTSMLRTDNIRIIAAAFFANMTTLPYLWFVFPALFSFTGVVVLGEATVLIAETCLYFLFLDISLRRAFLASLSANTGSVLVGLVLMPPFGG